MKRTVRSTEMPIGITGYGAPSCWSATPAALDRHANGRVMAVKPVSAFTAAQRPLGLAGGTTG